MRQKSDCGGRGGLVRGGEKERRKEDEGDGHGLCVLPAREKKSARPSHEEEREGERTSAFELERVGEPYDLGDVAGVDGELELLEGLLRSKDEAKRVSATRGGKKRTRAYSVEVGDVSAVVLVVVEFLR